MRGEVSGRGWRERPREAENRRAIVLVLVLVLLFASPSYKTHVVINVKSRDLEPKVSADKELVQRGLVRLGRQGEDRGDEEEGGEEERR